MNDIKKYLDNKNRNIIFLNEIDSTNNYAKQLVRNGEPSGTVITAKTQTAGKGRLGRSFCSPSGTGIYMSIILRPDYDMETVSLLTSCMSVAAARAIDKLYGTDIKIKWVNDLYLNGRKICGILTESAVNSEGKADFAIIGIGINVKSVKQFFPADLLSIASSLEDETGETFSLSEISAGVINELERILPELESCHFIEEYRSRSCVIGRDVIITKADREKTAKAVGISDKAGLIVRYSDGTEEILTSGEARIKPLQ